MIDPDPTVWVAKLDSSYESAFHQSTLKQLGTDTIVLPLTAKIGAVYGLLQADPKGWITDDEVIQPWRVYHHRA